MDEKSNKRASAPLEEQEANLKHGSSNGEQPKANPPLAPRAITSKRVVIPPNAKRIVQHKQPEAKPAEVAAPVVPPAPVVSEPEYIEPLTLPSDVQETTAAPIEAEPAATETYTPAEPVITTPPVARIEPAVTPPASSRIEPLTTVPSTKQPPTAVAPATRTEMGGGLKPAALPYRLAETELTPVPQVNPGRRRTIELVLWGLAALFLVVAAFFVATSIFPDLLPNLTGGNANVQPTITAVAIVPTSVPQPTTTQLPTNAPTPVAVETQAPISIPTPPADGTVFSTGPLQNISGWVAVGEESPHFADVNLHAGTFQGKQLSSIVQFNLRNYPQDSKVLFAALELTGRDASRLAQDGEWQIELVENTVDTDWSQATAEQIANAKSLGTIGAPMTAADLGQGRLNQIILSETERQLVEQQFKNGNIVFRLRGPAGTSDNLFTWESGLGSTAISAPTFHMVVVPGQYVIVTSTPEAENILTVAAYVVRGTDRAKRNGTPTPFPPGVATATPGGGVIRIPAETAIAQNAATAFARAAEATAFAVTTGTYTPTPEGMIVIFPTNTPAVIVSGLSTATPIPPDTDLLTIPINYAECSCRGQILILSDRFGGAKNSQVMLDQNGALLGKLSTDLYYNLAAAREPYSPDRTKRLIYPNNENGIQQIGYEDLNTKEVVILTNFSKGIAYDAAWSPDGNSIAFVSTERNNTDEIYVYQFDTGLATRITTAPDNLLPLSKHPTWSPDSQQIAFWSTLSGGTQIWVMNRDGSNLRNISNNSFNETDPVWVK